MWTKSVAAWGQQHMWVSPILFLIPQQLECAFEQQPHQQNPCLLPTNPALGKQNDLEVGEKGSAAGPDLRVLMCRRATGRQRGPGLSKVCSWDTVPAVLQHKAGTTAQVSKNAAFQRPYFLSPSACLNRSLQNGLIWLSVGNWFRPAGSPCWPNVRIDILSAGSSQKSPREGVTGPEIAALGAQVNSHNLECSQEAHSRGKAVPNSKEDSCFPPTAGTAFAKLTETHTLNHTVIIRVRFGLCLWCRALVEAVLSQCVRGPPRGRLGLRPLSALSGPCAQGPPDGGALAAASYPLPSLGLEVQFRPTEGLRKKGWLCVWHYLCTREESRSRLNPTRHTWRLHTVERKAA